MGPITQQTFTVCQNKVHLLVVRARLRVVSNFDNGDSGASEIHAYTREISRRRDSKGRPSWRRVSSWSDFCACVFRQNILLAVYGRVLLGLFRNRITRNRRYSCSFGSYSAFEMHGIRFTRNMQHTRSFGKFLAGNPTRQLRLLAKFTLRFAPVLVSTFL